jgi:hypothetical protein
MSDTISTKPRSGQWLREPGAQLLGFLGANITLGALTAVVIPLLVGRHAHPIWDPFLGAWRQPDLVSPLTIVSFAGGILLMAVAVRRIRTARR